MHPACNDSTVVQAGPRAASIALAAMTFAGLMLGTGLAWAQPTCPTRAPSFAVMAEHYPPAIKSSYTSAELRVLAAQATHRSPHPPWGFYASTFGYGVEVSPHEAHTCGMTVTVRLFLAPRLIEVAADGPCRPELVAEHYLLHARQDDLLLSRYAALTRDMLDGMQRTSADRTGNDRDAVVSAISAALERLLGPFDNERNRALAAADTEEELARLAKGCGHAT